MSALLTSDGILVCTCRYDPEIRVSDVIDSENERVDFIMTITQVSVPHTPTYVLSTQSSFGPVNEPPSPSLQAVHVCLCSTDAMFTGDDE